ncbi:2-oxoglutarate dehydrogenase E1 component [soil metagenome]
MELKGSTMFDEFGINAGYVEDLHARYLQSPAGVDEKWRRFFEEHANESATQAMPVATPTNGNGNGHAPVPLAPYANGTALKALADSASTAMPVLRLDVPHDTMPPADLLVDATAGGKVYALINAYRVRGHLFARVNPLGDDESAPNELQLENFGLSKTDMELTFPTLNIGGMTEKATLREIISHLEETYCRSIGVEFTQIEAPEQRLWLRQRMESTRNRPTLDPALAKRVLSKLTDAEAFEQFLAKNFLGKKRFSAEGAESLIAMLDVLIEECGAKGIDEIIFGMAHRGRLNVLVNTLGKSVRELFAAFDDNHPDRFIGGGDVKYHLGYSSDVVTESGGKVHLTMCFNPSHLEFVNPVVEGRVRAKQDRVRRTSVMPLLIHGDAAFIGQGIVPETLNLAGLEGYSTAGTLHIVVNNQIGFTTLPRDSRSTRYCTDITRMMRVPVFHVNGEDPEAVIWVAKLAIEYRQRFAQDVVIDMYCFRKYGHNETDEPRFTQPVMYSVIDKKPSVRQTYVTRLVASGIVTEAQAQDIAQRSQAALDAELTEARTGDWLKPPRAMEGLWAKYKGGPDASVPEVPTCVPKERLVELAKKMATLPECFSANPKVFKVFANDRRDAIVNNLPFDWGAAEHLAYATLLTEGVPVRITGQDSQRGTFTHRHATLFDTKTGKPYRPLANLTETQARFDIYDSPLSEAGVLGFEYGYSLDRPDGLVVWEAQFGDFANGAQVIIDQFLTSAEDKWLRLSGLVLLLPHGYEGMGPEHSSARLERFLQLAAEDNIQVVDLTTAAQFFHCLRRQVLRPWRKPLVVMTPKSLLRAKAASSHVEDLVSGSFQRVIPDTSVDASKVKRVLLCSGKVYYDLLDTRTKQGRTDVAIVRLEQLYPLDGNLSSALAPYQDGTKLVWVQDEPRNMGAWYFLNARVREFIGDRLPLSVVCRAESASPATGSHASHLLEQKMLMEAAFGA